MRLASRENISASLASLTSLARRKNAIYCQAWESRNLWVLHLSEAIFATKFRSKTRFSRFSLWNFGLWDSREASLATNFDSRVTRKSCENVVCKKRVSLLARISKSDSRVKPRHMFVWQIQRRLFEIWKPQFSPSPPFLAREFYLLILLLARNSWG